MRRGVNRVAVVLLVVIASPIGAHFASGRGVKGADEPLLIMTALLMGLVLLLRWAALGFVREDHPGDIS